MNRRFRPTAFAAAALLAGAACCTLPVSAGAAGHATAGARAAAGPPGAKANGAAPTPAPEPTPALLQKAQDVAIFALGLLGVDYRFGGNTPQAGLDCSGLVRYVFSQTTGIDLPRTAAAQGRIGARIARLDLVPGDLVFFNTRHALDSHVGIYLGDNRFVHAPSNGSEVSVASLDDGYWKKRFTGARRLIGVLTDVDSRAGETMASLPSPLAMSLAPQAATGAAPAVSITQVAQRFTLPAADATP